MEWISVKDKIKPIKGEYVLMANKREVFLLMAYYDHKDKCFRTSPMSRYEGASFWMSLPNPPKFKIT